MVGIQNSESIGNSSTGRRSRFNQNLLTNFFNQQQQQNINHVPVIKTLKEIETEVRKNLALVINKHPNSKISQSIRELIEETTQKKIVTVLTEIAEKPEICVDFDIPLNKLLEMYVLCDENPILSEAGYMIFSASQIFSRRVDSNFESAARIAAGIKQDLQTINEENTESNNQNSTTGKPTRKAAKRRTKPSDFLYEAEMIPKKIKVASDSRTTEQISDLCLLDPPKHYLKQWKQYKEWRQIQKKRMKGGNTNIPHSVVYDEQYIHPSIWKDSCIEDFDYEDDLETKRSFRIFTNYIEHRNNTLVNDVNFVLHFKVKDFIEAEQNRNDIENLPKRVWPPFCKNGLNCNINTRDFIREKFNINIECNSDNNDEDYIKNYMELEDEVLEQESWFEKENHGKSKRKTIDLTNDINNDDDNDDNEETPLISTSNNESLPTDQNISNTLLSTNTNINSSLKNSTMCNNNQINESIQNFESANIRNNDTTMMSITQNSNIETQIESTQEEEFDINKILCKLHPNDKGTYFRDLDEIDRAMLLPAVELVDIFKPMSNILHDNPNLLSNFSIYGSPLPLLSQSSPGPQTIIINNFLGMDNFHLQKNEVFQLPSELLKPKLTINLLKLNKNRITKRKLFDLPQEFDIWKKARTKSININKELEKKNRVIQNSVIPMTENFYGFDDTKKMPCPDPMRILLLKEFNERTKEEERRSNNKQKANDSILPSRTDSRDSGVGLMNSETNDEILHLDENQQTKDLLLTNNIDFNSIDVSGKTGEGKKSLSILSDSGIQSGIDASLIQNSQNKNGTSIQDNLSTNLQDEIELEYYSQDEINNWHKRLKPVLRYASGRHHFDIFGIGTDIIDTFPEDAENNDAEITIEDIMEDKDKSFISRYFLSTLLLATQRNISISKPNYNGEKPVEWNELKLKLISRQRHVVAPEDNVGIHSTISKRKQKQKSSISPMQSPLFSLSTPTASTSNTTLHENGFIASSTPSTSAEALRQCGLTLSKKLKTSTQTLNNSVVTPSATISSKPSLCGIKRNHESQINTNNKQQSSNTICDGDSSNNKSINNNYNNDDYRNLVELSKRFKPNCMKTALSYLEGISIINDKSTSNNINSNNSDTQNTTSTIELLDNSRITEETNNITNYVETTYIDNDGFIYPKKSKNFLNLSHKSRVYSDDTDSGFHSQISSSSQYSLVS